ncbi:MAG: type II toxin-antitoxin system RelE/ParE family toxin [Eggerthellaceae bacterium]|nr:type II toxin-antitoxin system RelE/ParE family toxin [Eggerthellaceae bacterium]
MTRYNQAMIKTFADKETRNVFLDAVSKKLPSEIIARALRKLDMLDSAENLDDLVVPPGNRLHALKGSRAGQHSISINEQWRICFRFEGEDAFEVEICDYH